MIDPVMFIVPADGTSDIRVSDPGALGDQRYKTSVGEVFIPRDQMRRLIARVKAGDLDYLLEEAE